MVWVNWRSVWRTEDMKVLMRSSAAREWAWMKRRALRISLARRSVGVGEDVGGSEVGGVGCDLGDWRREARSS